MTDTNPDRHADPQRDTVFDHAFDGIQEYDNPLPGWWVWLWAASFVFSFGYVAWYHIGVGPDIEQQYEASVARHLEKQLAVLGDITGDTETILSLMDDEAMMQGFAALYRGNCATCHANDGGGGIGPNLCDDHFNNIETPEDLYLVIRDGIAGTSMPAWGTRLREPQMIVLAAYVASLRGTTPEKPEPAYGSVIPPWSEFRTDAPAAPDATEAPADDTSASAAPAPPVAPAGT